MASQPVKESRLNKFINGVSPWISVLVIFIYAILCLINTTVYAFKLTLPAQYHPIITILWAVANTLGGLLLAMTIYGWALFFLRRPQSNSSAASKVVSGERALAKKIADATSHLGSSSATQSAQHGVQHGVQQGSIRCLRGHPVRRLSAVRPSVIAGIATET